MGLPGKAGRVSTRRAAPEPGQRHGHKGLVNLDPGKTHEVPEFKTNERCQSTGVWLERNGRYRVTFDSTDSFRDGHSIDGSEGFYSTHPTVIAAPPADGSPGAAPLGQR